MRDQDIKKVKDKITEIQKESYINGMKAGSQGMLGAVLDMCDTGKSVKEIKQFCEQMLNVQTKEGNIKN